MTVEFFAAVRSAPTARVHQLLASRLFREHGAAPRRTRGGQDGESV